MNTVKPASVTSLSHIALLLLTGALGSMALACVSSTGNPTTGEALGAHDVHADPGGDTTVEPGSGPKGGTVSLSQSKTIADKTSTYSSFASASFYNQTAAAGSRCKSTIIGSSCTVDECDVTTGAAPAKPGPTAGLITMSGGVMPAKGIALNAGELVAGFYGEYAGEARLFAGGDMLTVRAAGQANGVPAFVGSVIAPADIDVTAPKLSPTTLGEWKPAAIDRSKDLDVTWTGGGAGYVVVVLSTLDEDAQKSVEIRCSTAPTAPTGGALTVPKAALAKLHATGPAILGNASVTPTNIASFAAGDYDGLRFEVSGAGALGPITTK